MPNFSKYHAQNKPNFYYQAKSGNVEIFDEKSNFSRHLGVKNQHSQELKFCWKVNCLAKKTNCGQEVLVKNLFG